MKFMKGIIWGGIISAGLLMMCSDSEMMDKKYMMKKGKKWAKKMGIL